MVKNLTKFIKVVCKGNFLGEANIEVWSTILSSYLVVCTLLKYFLVQWGFHSFGSLKLRHSAHLQFSKINCQKLA